MRVVSDPWSLRPTEPIISDGKIGPDAAAMLAIVLAQIAVAHFAHSNFFSIKQFELAQFRREQFGNLNRYDSRHNHRHSGCCALSHNGSLLWRGRKTTIKKLAGPVSATNAEHPD